MRNFTAIPRVSRDVSGTVRAAGTRSATAAADMARLSIVACSLLAVGVLLLISGCTTAPTATHGQRNADPAGYTGGSSLPEPYSMPEVSLTDTSGRAYNLATTPSKPVTLLFFGYTHCPDVCPTTMGEMAGWFADLGDEADTLKAFFVTVDPERDTPEILDGYVSWVSDRVTGVTGKPEEVAKMVKAWKVLAEKVPGQGSDYTMNHTASVFLVNAEGGFEGTIAYQEATPTAIAKIRKLLGKAA